MSLRLELDEKLERMVREKAMREFGYQKGALKKAGTTAFLRWISDTEKNYPSETRFKKSFIKEVKKAEKRIKSGKGKTYTYDEFKKKFLSR